uniref:Glutathione transferase delta 4 n=1 Tax=Pardosa pseudoannulata TaxID=330961 RepID=A0A5Q0QNW4_9ARAC|nr:glutathione transferase delta 4 [Pardosa pseudoannulata]
MPIDLYSLPASGPCRAVIMTAQHLKVKLNVKNMDLFGGDQMKPEFLRMNPQHCVPTIDDDGFYLWESRAVQTYLVNKYAPDSSLYPKDPQARAVVDRMLYFDIGTLFATQGEWLRPQLFYGKPSDPVREEAFEKALELLEEFLSKTLYVAGENITVADFSVFSTLTFAETVADFNFKSFPKTNAWLQKLKTEVPNYKEIHEGPLLKFKELLKSRSKK